MAQLVFRQEGSRVLILLDGRLIESMPWQAAVQASTALLIKGRKAEEHAKANQIIGDSALLIRAGIPLGLSNNPVIVSEAVKEANHNRDLRRYLPGGIQSTAVVGTPAVIQSEAK